MLTKRATTIWRGLTSYANDLEVNEDQLRRTILLCLPIPAQHDDGFNFAGMYLDPGNLSREARQYHEPIKNLLTALCRGLLNPDGLANHDEPLGFLWEHCRHVRFALDWIPAGPRDYKNPKEYEDFEGSDKYYSRVTGSLKASPLGKFGQSMGGQDIVDPLCHFIVGECERVRESGEKLPIFICENSKCGKLFVPKKIKTKAKNRFCSSECKDTVNNQDQIGARTAEQFLRRLATHSANRILNKFASPAFRQKYEQHKTVARSRSEKHIQKI